MLFFTMAKTFALGRIREHRNLKLSQVQKEVTTINGREVACYVYSKCGLKITKEGLHHLI